MTYSQVKLSIIILTYNRPEELRKNVSQIMSWAADDNNIELIVVDNNSETPASTVLKDIPGLNVLTLEKNVGVAGRNEGIKRSTGDILITLDDDVFDFSYSDAQTVKTFFESDTEVAAVNFKVIDEVTKNQINWCHHRKLEEWGGIEFETYEISEGAVAFRRQALEKSGLYPDYFFISHEGADLALRLMNEGYKIFYSPEIKVSHSHAEGGRPGWRRYYYDTRNLIWLSVRCYRLDVAFRKISVGLLSLLIYSARDGYLKYWLKGLFDGIYGIKKVKKHRIIIRSSVWIKYSELEKNNPSMFYMIKKRFFGKNIRI